MTSINNSHIVGRLGGQPEVRHTQSGKAVANLSVATNNVWYDGQGNKQEETTWHRVVIWGKSAEFAGNQCRKGDLVYCSGRRQNREWQDREGKKRKSNELVATKFQLLSKNKQGSSSGQQKPGGASPSSSSSQSTQTETGGAPPDAGKDDFEQSFDDDDIPF